MDMRFSPLAVLGQLRSSTRGSFLVAFKLEDSSIVSEREGSPTVVMQ